MAGLAAVVQANFVRMPGISDVYPAVMIQRLKDVFAYQKQNRPLKLMVLRRKRNKRYAELW